MRDARQVDAVHFSAEFPLILEICNFWFGFFFFFPGRKEVKHCWSIFAHIFAVAFFYFYSHCGIQGSQYQPVLQNIKALVAKQITQGPFFCREFFFLKRINLFSFQVQIKEQESHFHLLADEKMPFSLLCTNQGLEHETEVTSIISMQFLGRADFSTTLQLFHDRKCSIGFMI